MSAASVLDNENATKLSPSQQELVEILQHGARLCKIPSNSFGTPKFRKFWVNEDMDSLNWESLSKFKSSSKIVLADVKSIIRGQTTPLFESYKKKHAQFLEKHAQASFSILGDNKTLDLMCEDLMEIDTWVKALQILVEFNKKKAPSRKRGTSNEGLQRMTISKTSLSTISKEIGESIKGKRRQDSHSNILSLFKKKANIKDEDDSSATTINSSPTTTTSPSTSSPPTKPLPPIPKKPSIESLLEEDKRRSNRQYAPVTTNDDKHLFEFVVVVKVKEENQKLVPYISYSFPPTNVQKKENKMIMMSIPSFCFPDVEILKKAESIQSKNYSFILTDIDGTRRHGYCRRMLSPGKGPRYPDSYCIISSHSCFGIFSTLLDNVEQRNNVNSVSVFSFLKTVLANPFPERGCSTTIRSHNPKSGMMEDIVLSRPNTSDPMLEYVEFDTLFSKLKVDQILSLFLSLLFERRVIFVSNDIAALSSCMHAAIAVLYPFSWQHVYIPVLPRNLLEYVCSPVPFVVGVLSIHKPYILELPMEEVVIVDLDSGTVEAGDDFNVIPQAQAKVLKSALAAAAQKASKTTAINGKEVSDAFLTFFLGLFGNYRAFKSKGHEFDTDGFIKAKSKKDKKFFETFKNSQMYERWAYERNVADEGKQVLGQFEKLSQR